MTSPVPATRSTMAGPYAHRVVLMPHEAARLTGVTRKTLARWADEGRLPFTTTLGGHRRYRRDDVLALMNAERPLAPGPPPRYPTAAPATAPTAAPATAPAEETG